MYSYFPAYSFSSFFLLSESESVKGADWKMPSFFSAYLLFLGGGERLPSELHGNLTPVNDLQRPLAAVSVPGGRRVGRGVVRHFALGTYQGNRIHTAGCGCYIKGFHMPWKACACEKKGMMQLLDGFAARLALSSVHG